MRHTRCALGTGVQSCALPIYRLFSSGDRRLQHLAPPQFRRRADALLILPGPEQRCGRNVDPFEALVDAIEVGGDIVADLGRELVDEEGAAGAQGFGRTLGGLDRKSGGEGRMVLWRGDVGGCRVLKKKK